MGIDVKLTEANRLRVEGMYAAGARGDSQAVMACVDENVVVMEPPYLSFGGTYSGIAAFKELIATIGGVADVSQLEVVYTVAENDRVIGMLRFPDRKTGKPLQLLEQSTFRDGKIVEMKIFYFDAGSLIGARG